MLRNVPLACMKERIWPSRTFNIFLKILNYPVIYSFFLYVECGARTDFLKEL